MLPTLWLTVQLALVADVCDSANAVCDEPVSSEGMTDALGEVVDIAEASWADLSSSDSASAAAATCAAFACPASAGCDQQWGPAAAQGSDAQLGFDINVATGNLFHSETDLVVTPATGPELVFRRYYNSQSVDEVGLGRGWSHSYSWRAISLSSTQVKLRTEWGRYIYFTLVSSVWVPQPGEFGTLTGSAAAGFTYKDKHGTQFVFDVSTSQGRLLSITPADSPSSLTVTYTTSTGVNIDTVSSGGKSLSFLYRSNLLVRVLSPIAARVDYDYLTVSTVVTLRVAQTPDTFEGLRMLNQYTYANVSANGATFSAGGSPRLTRIEKLQAVGARIAALFSYNGSNQVVRANAGLVGTTFLRDVQLAYTLCTDMTSTTTATFVGGSKTANVENFASLRRMTLFTATAGSGTSGEWSTGAYEWAPDLTLASVTDGRGAVTVFNTYDAKGNPTSITEAAGTPEAVTTTFTWHPVLSRPLTISRPSVSGLGTHRYVFDYDADYNSTYNSTPTNLLRQVVEEGFTDTSLSGAISTSRTTVRKLEYDALNRVFRTTEPNGAVTRFGFFGVAGNNNDNRLQYVRYEPTVGNIIQTNFDSYDADGRLISKTDPNATTESWSYSPNGRVLQHSVARSGTTVTESFAFNRAGDLLSHTQNNGSRFVFDTDSGSRVWRTRAESSAGAVDWSKVLALDSFGRPLAVRLYAVLGANTSASCLSETGLESCKQYSYDNFRRTNSVRLLAPNNEPCSGANCLMTATYDGNGNLATRTEIGTRTFTFGRDMMSRVTSVTLPTGKFSTIGYDNHGRMAWKRDPKDAANGGSGGSRLTAFTYDDFGHLIAVDGPDTGLLVSNFDASGLKTSSRDARGLTVTFEYDGANRLRFSRPVSGGAEIEYRYDEVGTLGDFSFANSTGRLTSIKTGNGDAQYTHFKYDMLGRAIAVLEERGPLAQISQHLTSFDYGAQGELLGITYPSGKRVDYQYPGTVFPNPRPTSATTTFLGSPATLFSGASYYSDGTLASLTYGNGSTRTIERNLRSEVTRVTSGAVVDQRLEYDPTGMGVVTGIHNFQGTWRAWDWSFGYDSLNRMTSYTTNVRPGGETFTWTYDEVGNRLSETKNGIGSTYNYDSNTNNRLASISGLRNEGWFYGLTGFVEGHYVAGGELVLYEYDARNLLTALRDSGSDNVIDSYEYDGLLRRSKHRDAVTGHWSRFFYDGAGRVIEEYKFEGQFQNGFEKYSLIDSVYIAGTTEEVARIQTRRAVECGACSYSRTDEDIYYVHEDARGAPFSIESKVLAREVWAGEIDPFGKFASVGLPGSDGKIGTGDDVPEEFANLANFSAGRYDVRELLNFMPGTTTPVETSTGRGLGPDLGAIASIFGASTFSPNGLNTTLLTVMRPALDAAGYRGTLGGVGTLGFVLAQPTAQGALTVGRLKLGLFSADPAGASSSTPGTKPGSSNTAPGGPGAPYLQTELVPGLDDLYINPENYMYSWPDDGGVEGEWIPKPEVESTGWQWAPPAVLDPGWYVRDAGVEDGENKYCADETTCGGGSGIWVTASDIAAAIGRKGWWQKPSRDRGQLSAAWILGPRGDGDPTVIMPLQDASSFSTTIKKVNYGGPDYGNPSIPR